MISYSKGIRKHLDNSSNYNVENFLILSLRELFKAQGMFSTLDSFNV